MPNVIQPKKVYNRQLDPNAIQEEDSLAKLFQQVPDKSKVLDIGCGTGSLGEMLIKHKQCHVTGVDFNPESVGLAQQKLNQAVCLDISQTPVSGVINETFDVIILADILEHLTQPEKLLTDCHQLLNAEGKLLISIPNAAYIGAILSLYYDEWEYGEEGILDTTHVRFYTRHSIAKLLNHSGFNGYFVDYVNKDLTTTEFTQRADCLNKAVFDWLTNKADAVAYQFIITADIKPKEAKQTTAVLPPAIHFQHIVKLYWQTNNNAPFTDQFYQLQRGIMGQTNVLDFALQTTSLAKFRLDFADRKSTYLINNIQIYSGDALQHTINDKDTISYIDCIANTPSFPARLLASGTNSHLNIELAKQISGHNLRFVIEMEAPIDENNLSFSDSSIQRVHYQQVIDTLNQQIQSIKANNQQQQAEIETLQNQINQSQSSYDMLVDQLARLKNSTSWKLTAPLRKLIDLKNRQQSK